LHIDLPFNSPLRSNWNKPCQLNLNLSPKKQYWFLFKLNLIG